MEENNFLYFLKKIWPTIYRIINEIIYFIFNLIKGIFSYAIKQIKGAN